VNVFKLLMVYSEGYGGGELHGLMNGDGVGGGRKFAFANPDHGDGVGYGSGDGNGFGADLWQGIFQKEEL
jgi:hypothetical protein